MPVGGLRRFMSDHLRTPERRICERCGRLERHNEDIGGWRVERVGDVHCIHEWDIDGTFVPVTDADVTADRTAVEEC